MATKKTCGAGAWWKTVKDPTDKAKARRYYYAQRARDLAGMKAASSEARRKLRATKESQKAERQKRARVTREERRGARA
jgi:hypothetical protein